MVVTVTAPVGGITADLDGEARRLVLRNREIERFEEHHAPLGIFEVLDRFVGNGPKVQARHVRDLVTLGLVGGGMNETAADALMREQPPSANVHLRAVAQNLVVTAFLPPEGGAKKSGGDGSRPAAPSEAAAGMSPDASATS